MYMYSGFSFGYHLPTDTDVDMESKFDDSSGYHDEERQEHPSAHLITAITNWGCVELANSGFQFYCCRNLIQTGPDTPNLSGLNNNLECMFSGATSLNCKYLSDWHTENVVNMSAMFCHATSLNVDLSRLDTSAVTIYITLISPNSTNNPLTTEEYPFSLYVCIYTINLSNMWVLDFIDNSCPFFFVFFLNGCVFFRFKI